MPPPNNNIIKKKKKKKKRKDYSPTLKKKIKNKSMLRYNGTKINGLDIVQLARN